MKLSVTELTKKFGIGLTGGVACGKTTVAKILISKGFIVIDADQLARDAVKQNTKGLAKIVEHFGGSVLSENGDLNREYLGEIIFNDSAKRKLLESILHPIIQELLEHRLLEHELTKQPKIWFYEASLLYETGRDQDFRQMWVVSCSKTLQIARLAQRDRKSRVTAERIISSQMSLEQKVHKADINIETSSKIEELEIKILQALEKLPGRSGINRLTSGGDFKDF
jgi:dephospho-CoA kinase